MSDREPMTTDKRIEEIRERVEKDEEQEIRHLASEERFATEREQTLERLYPEAHPGLRWVLAIRFLLSEVQRLRKVEEAAREYQEARLAVPKSYPQWDRRNKRVVAAWTALSNTLEQSP